MNFQFILSRFVLLPIGKTFSRRKYFKALKFQKFLEKTQYWSREEIENLQNQQFQKLIRHCANNVPFYRRCLNKNNLTPDDFQSIKDITKLPIITKQIINNHKHELIASNFNKKLIKFEKSGGTTGIPAVFGTDISNSYMLDAKDWRFWKYAGFIPGMKTVLFWAHPLELEFINSIYLKLKNLMDNTKIFNSWNISESNFQKISNYLKHIRPEIIRGYASAIYFYVQYCKTNNISFKYSPKSIIITADKISELQKKEISDFFKCDIFDEYGCREFSFIAHECEKHEGLHLAEELFVFECLNPITSETTFNGNGELIVTPLFNFAMPLLRYRLGDEVIISENYCSCGRKLRVISELKGRTIDYVITKSNRMVHGTYFFDLFGLSKSIFKFQIHQFKKGEIIIFIVRNREFCLREILDTMNCFKNHFHDDLIGEIKYVNDIVKSPSGKTRICISHIASQLISNNVHENNLLNTLI